MRKSSISIRAVKLDPELLVEKRARKQTAKWNVGDVSLKKYDPVLVTSCHIATLAYSHTPIDVQLQIALFTFLAICIDDFAVPNVALEEFMERLYSGSSQLHPLLDRYVECLRSMKDYFPPYAVKLIIKASVDFINNMAVEEELETMALRPSALNYVTVKRFYNGIGDAYACFVFDKFAFPHVTTYLQAIPYVFSIYQPSVYS